MSFLCQMFSISRYGVFTTCLLVPLLDSTHGGLFFFLISSRNFLVLHFVSIPTQAFAVHPQEKTPIRSVLCLLSFRLSNQTFSGTPCTLST